MKLFSAKIDAFLDQTSNVSGLLSKVTQFPVQALSTGSAVLFSLCIVLSTVSNVLAKETKEARNLRRDRISAELKNKFATHKARHPKKKRIATTPTKSSASGKAQNLGATANINKSTGDGLKTSPSQPVRNVANQPKMYNISTSQSGNTPKVELPANFQKEIHFSGQ